MSAPEELAPVRVPRDVTVPPTYTNPVLETEHLFDRCRDAGWRIGQSPYMSKVADVAFSFRAYWVAGPAGKEIWTVLVVDVHPDALHSCTVLVSDDIPPPNAAKAGRFPTLDEAFAFAFPA